MSWIAAGMAAAGVATSLASSAASNKGNAQAFVTNANQVKKDYEYNISQLQQQMSEANDNIALEMSANRWNALKDSAVTTNKIVEHNIAGNTATKLYNQSALSAMFAHNALAKKAEDTMASYGYQMKNVEQEANNAIYSAAAMAKKSYISPLAAGTAAAQAGMSGYTMGSKFGGTSSVTSVSGGSAGDVSGSLTESSGYGMSSVSMSTGNAEISTPFSSSYFGGNY